MLATKQPKPKKCRVKTCRTSFIPRQSFQTWCSPDCAVVIARGKQEKARKSLAQVGRADIKVRKEALKSRGDHMREAQQAFNEFIRARDQAAGHHCISSGKPLDWSGNAVDAGHYRSVGSAPHLRFDERNCHAQSKQNNRFLPDRPYRAHRPAGGRCPGIRPERAQVHRRRDQGHQG